MEAVEGARPEPAFRTACVLCVSPSLLVFGLRETSPFLFCFPPLYTLQARRCGNRSKAEWMSCFARSASLNGFQGRLSVRAPVRVHVRVHVCVKAGEVERREERAYMCIMYVYANACVRLSPFVPVRLRFSAPRLSFYQLAAWPLLHPSRFSA